jgi:hypothetical protein
MTDALDRQPGSTLRWGGVAGVAGSVLLLVVFAIVAVFVGMDTISAEDAVARFPDVRAARTVENGLYLVVLVLWVIHALALHRALRSASPALALFGTALSILGLAMLAAGALPHVASAPIADLYHAPQATLQDQSTLVLLWHATQGMFDALLVTGLVIVPMGLLALGMAMRADPAFGKGTARSSLALGGVGLAAAAALLVDVSPIGAIGVLALVVYHLVAGWKVHRLPGGDSRGRSRRLTGRRSPATSRRRSRGPSPVPGVAAPAVAASARRAGGSTLRRPGRRRWRWRPAPWPSSAAGAA